MSQMDISQVQMGRSRQGIHMLCVDNYLYHLERGNSICSWVCNKSKSRYQPCPSRIATAIVDGDVSRHQVIEVTNEHIHERCSEGEISKAVERNLQAVAGLEDGYDLNFKKNKLYRLQTAHGRHMIWVRGFLYRLESKSITTTTHRWECIKQNPPCKVRILTECLSNGTHRVRDRQVVEHCHVGYNTFQLNKLIRKNNITIQSANNDTKPQLVTYTYSEDPLKAISTGTKKDFYKKKFTFLPSAQGHKILCLDNYIYHNMCCPTVRQQWGCLFRCDKVYKCYVRAITEMTNKGPIIVRVIGRHCHQDHTQYIQQRLHRILAEKIYYYNVEKVGMSDENPDENTDRSFSSDLDSDDDYMNSTFALPTKLDEMRQENAIHDDDSVNAEKALKTCKNIRNENCNTNYECVAEEMTARKEIKIECIDKDTYADDEQVVTIVKTEDDYLDTALPVGKYLAGLEDITVREEIKVECLDINTYADDEQVMAVVKTENDYLNTIDQTFLLENQRHNYYKKY